MKSNIIPFTPVNEPERPKAAHARPRNLEELAAECRRRRFPFNRRLFDEGASDYVHFDWRFKNVVSRCMVNTINGCFFGRTSTGVEYDSNETTHDGEAWFQMLLDVVLVPLHEEAVGLITLAIDGEEGK